MNEEMMAMMSTMFGAMQRMNNANPMGVQVMGGTIDDNKSKEYEAFKTIARTYMAEHENAEIRPLADSEDCVEMLAQSLAMCLQNYLDLKVIKRPDGTPIGVLGGLKK